MVYFNDVLTDFLQMTFPGWKNTTQYKLDIFYRARHWATPVFKSIFVGPSCRAKVRITCGNICRIEALSSYFSFLLPQHHDEWIPTEAWGNAQLTHLPPETLSQHHWKIRWRSRWICCLVGRSRCMWHIATPVPFVLLPLARSYSPGELRPFALCSVYAPCYPYSFIMHERRHHTTDDMAEDWKGLFLTSMTSRSPMRLEAMLNSCPTSLLTAAGKESNPKLDSGTTLP